MECILCKDTIEHGGDFGCGCTSRIHVHCMINYYRYNKDFKCPCCKRELSCEFIENIMNYREIWKEIKRCENRYKLPYLYTQFMISKYYVIKDEHFTDYIS